VNARRSWAILAVLAAVFLLLLVVLRESSRFLRVERGAGTAAPIAAQTGLPLVDLLALHELHGGGLDEPALRRLAEQFGKDRVELRSEPLAALASVIGLDPVQRSVRRDGPIVAEQRWRREPEGVSIVRWETMRERFRDRLPGR
jgi:hypothetical protein